MVKCVAVLIFVLAVTATACSAQSILETLDENLWWELDRICSDLAIEREQTVSPSEISFLRMIEFTRTGYRSHSVFPSAAKSLIKSPQFDPSRPTVIFAHGFTDSPLLLSGQTFALAYEQHGGYNVLAIDSSKLIKALYFRSSTMVKYIGEYLGTFLYDLTQNGVSVDDFTLVGHSLGAHISGFAGKTYRRLAGKSLPRIIGMDPAGPCFSSVGPEGRLDATDADFVQVIHTNKGVYGINKAIGDVDFFPNGGGMEQPGCLASVCSHNRVWVLFEESVNSPQSFVAVKCKSWDAFANGQCDGNPTTVMGFATPTDIRGTYYLKTRNSSPYAMGTKGATV